MFIDITMNGELRMVKKSEKVSKRAREKVTKLERAVALYTRQKKLNQDFPDYPGLP